MCALVTLYRMIVHIKVFLWSGCYKSTFLSLPYYIRFWVDTIRRNKTIDFWYLAHIERSSFIICKIKTFFYPFSDLFSQCIYHTHIWCICTIIFELHLSWIRSIYISEQNWFIFGVILSSLGWLSIWLACLHKRSSAVR